MCQKKQWMKKKVCHVYNSNNNLFVILFRDLSLHLIFNDKLKKIMQLNEV